MLIEPREGPGVPTASLREILRNSDVHESARIEDPEERENLALYLDAFGLDAERLTREHELGVNALRAIQESGTYRGFADFFNGGEPVCPKGVNPIDYQIGVDKAGEIYRENQDKEVKVIVV